MEKRNLVFEMTYNVTNTFNADDNPNEGLYLTEVCGKSGLTYGEPKNQKQPRVKKLKKDDVSLKTMFTSGVFAETWKGE